MELAIGLYLVIASAFGVAYKEGIIKDDTTIKTYQFEKHAAEINNDQLLVTYLDGRIKQMKEIKVCVE